MQMNDRHIFVDRPDEPHRPLPRDRSPFFMPPDEEGRAYSTPLFDAIFIALCVLTIGLAVGGVWIVVHYANLIDTWRW